MKDVADGESEVAKLRGEVTQLQASLAEAHQELLTHRHFLEQCMETRKGVTELLANREAFAQCLEFREGIQAVLGSAQLFGEFGDRIAELDLSLAGVSDNTARHGKAISALTEQQKRTSSTLESVVRVVKRLAHNHPRSQGPSEQQSTAATPAVGPEVARVISNGRSSSTVCSTRMVEAPLHHANSADEQFVAVAGQEDAGAELHSTQQPMEWWDGHHRCDEAPRIATNHDILLDDEHMEYAPSGDGAWEWPGGWNMGWEDEIGIYPGPPGFEGPGSFHPSEAEERRYWSGSSSCGSDGRPWRRRSGRSGGANAKGCSSGQDIGILDPGDVRSRTSRRNVSANSGMSTELKGCVNGVLAKIEEALINLDSNSREGPGGNSRTTSRTASGHTSRHGAPEGVATTSGTQRTPRAAPLTAHNPHTPRGRAPRVRPGSAPYNNLTGHEPTWQQTDSWA